jgi:lipopolysaccharide transport system permease protein
MIEKNFRSTIKPKKSLLDINIKELLAFKDLLFLFVKRDFISVYKQTILGPLWFFLQPILTTVIFTFVFGRIAGLPTDGMPQALFYLSGITCWNYFADCLTKTSSTFIDNQNIFGKVYFPRLITPLSIVISSLIKFGIQFFLFLLYYFYELSNHDNIHGNFAIFLIPILIILMGFLGLGLGMIISSLTTKYKDLRFLVQFGIQLWMYITPVIYSLSSLTGKTRIIALLNPMTSIIETFKYAFFGAGTFNVLHLLYTTVITFVVLIAGVLIFNRTEQNFMDTV